MMTPSNQISFSEGATCLPVELGVFLLIAFGIIEKVYTNVDIVTKCCNTIGLLARVD